MMFFMKLLAKLDTFIVNKSGWKHIPFSRNNFMYLNPCIYHGNPVKLKDGTLISEGEHIAELHIDNTSIKRLNTSYPNLIRLLRGELAALSRALKEYPDIKVKAIFGISVFYDIAERQGFTIVEIDNKFKRLFISIGENILRLGLKNSNRKTRKKFLFSKKCWLSREQILNIH
jgi:hypothetical protein